MSLAIARKTTIPVLSAVRVEECDGYVDFSGTDLDLAVRYRLPMETKAAKPFLLPALRLEAFTKLLQREPVTITCSDDRRATLRCGRSNTRIPLQDASNFPAITVQDADTGMEIPQLQLARMLSFVEFSIAQEESRYTLNAALMEVGGGKLSLVTTDGHRLSIYEVDTDLPDTTPTLIPAGMIHAITKVADSGSDAPLKISHSDQQVFANVSSKTASVALAHRKITGSFPGYRAVIPAECQASIVLDAASAVAALRRCSAFADNRSQAVVLTVTPNELKMRAATADKGETDESIEVRSAGTFGEFRIGFCVTYLLDALSRLKGDVEMRFSRTDGQGAAVIVAAPVEDELFTYVLMPMRV